MCNLLNDNFFLIFVSNVLNVKSSEIKKLKDDVLFWLDLDIFHIGLAKTLQEKYDCNLYAIVDCNNSLKKFFTTQNIVKLKKFWFLRDFISPKNKTPDINYLTMLEKKYNIGLWKLAYGERYFFQFNDFYKFNQNEILAIIEQQCKFFESVLDETNPNFVILRVTDLIQLELFRCICKSRKIKILTINHTRIGSRWMISEETDIHDNLLEENELIIKERTFEDLQKYVKSYSVEHNNLINAQTSLFKKFQAMLRYIIICNNDYRKYYANYGRTRIKVLINQLFLLIKIPIRKKFLKQNSIQTIKKDESFIYFPLHLEPERTISIPAPYYTNQIEVITNIAKSMPANFKLYVKEHPAQVTAGWRKISYYKQIIELPNVFLVHPSVSNDEMIKNCSLVTTIAGTSGLEAAIFGKPSIVFSDVIYSSLSSVSRVKNLEDLPILIQKSLVTTVSVVDLNKFISKIEQESFDSNLFSFYIETWHEFFYGGFLIDVNIPINKMRVFLEKHTDLFEKIVPEYIKKIQEYKKLQTMHKEK